MVFAYTISGAPGFYVLGDKNETIIVNSVFESLAEVIAFAFYLHKEGDDGSPNDVYNAWFMEKENEEKKFDLFSIVDDLHVETVDREVILKDDSDNHITIPTTLYNTVVQQLNKYRKELTYKELNDMYELLNAEYDGIRMSLEYQKHLAEFAAQNDPQ